ncbi:hypothetical protein ABL78_0667 [Leptomonas seymouri]|uniref:Uncharacterized protein n=1 Tax=Leptomonas seymouri TaxID=5684 RepID=A0A0N1IBT2_LEPSE|nr:hypothetical protein ABL78_0667 [Leptomonas seymouri]|eukprot:KPI90285.1 hypothetical protein ABL78_0667 [Leptomonas seymouri]
MATSVKAVSAPQSDAQVPATMMIFTTASDASALCRAAAVNREMNKRSLLKSTVSTSNANDLNVQGDSTEPLQVMVGSEKASSWTVVPLVEHSNDVARPLKSSQGNPVELSEEQLTALSLLRQLQCELKQRTAFRSPDTSLSPSDALVRSQTVSADSVIATDNHTSDPECGLLCCRLNNAMTGTEVIPHGQPAFVWSEAITSDGQMRVLHRDARCSTSEQVNGNTEGDVTDAAGKGATLYTTQPSFLCVDVGGLYALAQDPRKGFTHTQLTPTVQPTQRDGSLSQTQRRPIDEFNEQREAASSTASLMALLHQRLTSAGASFPFRQNAQGVLALPDVWVVPLSVSELSALTQKGGLPLDDFANFVVLDSESCHSSERASARPTSLRDAMQMCVRIAQQAPDLQFCIPLCQAQSWAARRKRRREEGEAVAWRDGRCTLQDPEDTTLHLCAPETTPTRLRIMASTFLSQSCYFSRWCCAEDFDVTEFFKRGCRYNSEESSGSKHSAGCVACTSTQREVFHVFYAALQRSIEAAEALISESWAEVWDAGDASTAEGAHPAAVQLTTAALPRTSVSGSSPKGLRSWLHMADLAHEGIPTDDLFNDTDKALPRSISAMRSKGKVSTGLPVWPVKALWDLWTRLGWTPPRLPSTFLVQLCEANASTSAVGDERTLPRSLTPAEWMAFVARCTELLDEKYVQQVLADADEESAPNVSQNSQFDAETNDGAEAAHSEDFSCTSVGGLQLGHSIQSSHVKWERLDTLRRIFSMRTALLSGGNQQGMFSLECKRLIDSDGGAMAGSASRCFGGREVAAAPNHENAGFLPSYASPAAQALAADIAATIPAAPKTSSTECEHPQMPEAFSNTWALGVLESPALFFPSDQSDLHSSVLEGVARIGSPLPSFDSLAAPCSAAMDEFLCKGPSCPSAPMRPPLQGRPDGATPIDVLSSEEAFCEVADIAELRWRTHLGALTNPPTCENAFCSTTRPKGDGDVRCACCCARACRQAAVEAPSLWCEESSSPGSQTRTPAAAGMHESADPTAEWLYSMFTDFLKRNGVLHTPSLLDTAGADPEVQLSASEKEANAWERMDSKACDASTAPPTGEALSAILTNTIVRIVQQNKAVVRRVMQLVQSYESTASVAGARSQCACTAEGDASSKSDAEDTGAAAEPTDEVDKETLTRNVWRCFSGAEGGCTTHEENDYASAARQLAARQLQAFWANVASLTRQSVLREYIALPRSPLSGAPLDTSLLIGATGAVSGEQEAGENAGAAFACGTIELYQEEERHQSDNFGAAKGATLDTEGDKRRGGDWCGNAAKSALETCGARFVPCHDGPLTHSSPVCATLPSLHRSPGTNANAFSEEQRLHDSSAAFVREVEQLNGLRAMQLYMQRVLCCTTDSGKALSLPHSAEPDVVPEGSRASVGARFASTEEGKRSTDPLTFAKLLQPHVWLQHALFILSYGLAGSCMELRSCPTQAASSAQNSGLHCGRDESAAQSSCVQDTSADAAAAGAYPTVPPRLATFRVLRNGKLALDAWILAALEEYASRWYRILHRCSEA